MLPFFVLHLFEIKLVTNNYQIKMDIRFQFCLIAMIIFRGTA